MDVYFKTELLTDYVSEMLSCNYNNNNDDVTFIMNMHIRTLIHFDEKRNVCAKILIDREIRSIKSIQVLIQ